MTPEIELKNAIVWAINDYERKTRKRVSGLTLDTNGDEFIGARYWNLETIIDHDFVLIDLDEKSKQGNTLAWGIVNCAPKLI